MHDSADIIYMDPKPFEPSVASVMPNVGVLVLANDTSIERELSHLLGNRTFNLLVTRLVHNPECNADNLSNLQNQLADPLSLLVPNDRLDVVAFGCTSAVAAIGISKITDLFRDYRPDSKFLSPITSAMDILKASGLRKLSIVTPYTEDVNRLIDDCFTSNRFDVLRFVSFGVSFEKDIAAIGPNALRAAANKANSPEVEAIFISCTGLNIVDQIDDLEKAAGKPILTSNQVLAWDILRSIDQRPVHELPGCLMKQGCD